MSLKLNELLITIRDDALAEGYQVTFPNSTTLIVTLSKNQTELVGDEQYSLPTFADKWTASAVSQGLTVEQTPKDITFKVHHR